MNPLHHLFIIDPFSSLISGHDTSLALMRAALRRGHRVSQCEIKDIMWQDSTVQAITHGVEEQGTTLSTFTEKRKLELAHESSLVVWMRKDPPVDFPYLRVCQLLRLVKAKVPVLNDPDVLITCDEKLLSLEFPDLIPRTWVLQNISEIKELVRRARRLIAKPIGGKGGEGILLLSADDRNLGSLLELLTDGGRRKVIVQEYLEAAREGDKRILLLDGAPLGALMRIPSADDNRGNMAAGASITKCPLTDVDIALCEAVRPRLRQLGLYFVGLDVIGGKITEINITSPTCLEEIAALEKADLGAEIMTWCEERYAGRGGSAI